MKTITKKPATKINPTKKAIDNATTKAVIEKDRKLKIKDNNYLYKFQLAEHEMGYEEIKRKRSKLRRNLEVIMNRVIVSKGKDPKVIKEFISFYKKEFILNDFSLESITNTKEADKIEDFNKVLTIAKASL